MPNETKITIRLDSYYKDTIKARNGKSYDIYKIEGTRIDNGNDYSTHFFANNSELVSKLKQFGSGDIITITRKKDGRWWNTTDIEEGNIENKQTKSKQFIKALQQFRSPDELNRESALRLACEYVFGLVEKEILKKVTEELVFQLVSEYSKRFDYYLKNGVFTKDEQENMEDSNNSIENELCNDEEDDDIPF